MGNLPGFEVKYAIMNDSGKYTDALAVSVKDVAKKNVKVKATVSETADPTNYREFLFSVNVTAAAAVVFGFDQDGNEGTGTWSTPESTFDGYDYVLVDTTTEKTATTYKSDSAAVKADQETWMAYFKDYYDITSKN
jgi:hypothetical protein